VWREIADSFLRTQRRERNALTLALEAGPEPEEAREHRNNEDGYSIACVRGTLNYGIPDLRHWKALLEALEVTQTAEPQAGPAPAGGAAKRKSAHQLESKRAVARRTCARQQASERKTGKRYRSDVTGDGPSGGGNVQPRTPADEDHDVVNHLGPPALASGDGGSIPLPLRQLIEAELLAQPGQAALVNSQLMIQSHNATLTQ
jgi:hypothetical protein